MKNLLLLIAGGAMVTGSAIAQTLTNASVAVITPPAVIVHQVTIPNGIAQIDPQAPAGRTALVRCGGIDANGNLKLIITYK